MCEQIKSKQRVADHGEVFTNEREVKAMCDLVGDEVKKIDSTVLDIAQSILIQSHSLNLLPLAV